MKQLNQQQIKVLRSLVSGQKEIISIATALCGNSDNKYQITQDVMMILKEKGLVKLSGQRSVTMFELTEKGVEAVRNYREKK